MGRVGARNAEGQRGAHTLRNGKSLPVVITKRRIYSLHLFQLTIHPASVGGQACFERHFLLLGKVKVINIPFAFQIYTAIAL